MKILITILILLIPMLVHAQQIKGPIHDLSAFPTLQGTQDAISGFITKGNETKYGLPFSLTVEGMYHRFVSVQLSITKTNQLADFSCLFLQSERVPAPLWIPVSPIRDSATNVIYSMQLPLYVVNDGVFVLACGKDEKRNLPPKLPDVFVKLQYDKRYTIRLKSYIPLMSIVPDLPPKNREEKESEDEGGDIEINFM